MASVNTENISITRLSQLIPTNEKSTPPTWKKLKNQWNDTPSSDYAFSVPFQCFTQKSANQFKKICETYYHSNNEYHTERTSACLRGCKKLEQAVFKCKKGLELVASKLVGIPLKLHNMNYEWAHINVQRTVQSNPVDNWHQDSMPYVLVTVLTNHVEDEGGSLVVRPIVHDEIEYSNNNSNSNSNSNSISNEKPFHELPKNLLMCKLKYPGESVLVQGSQIWHKAEPSQIGERLTMVTSFVPESCYVYDSSSIRIAVQYTPPSKCIHQFLNHVMLRLKRVQKNDESDTVTKEIVKVITAMKEIQKIISYDNNKKNSNCELIQAFEKWASINHALGMWLKIRLKNKNVKQVRNTIENSKL